MNKYTASIWILLFPIFLVPSLLSFDGDVGTVISVILEDVSVHGNLQISDSDDGRLLSEAKIRIANNGTKSYIYFATGDIPDCYLQLEDSTRNHCINRYDSFFEYQKKRGENLGLGTQSELKFLRPGGVIEFSLPIEEIFFIEKKHLWLSIEIYFATLEKTPPGSRSFRLGFGGAKVLGQ